MPIRVAIERVRDRVPVAVLRTGDNLDPAPDQPVVDRLDVVAHDRDDEPARRDVVTPLADPEIALGSDAVDPAIALVDDEIESQRVAVEAAARGEITDEQEGDE